MGKTGRVAFLAPILNRVKHCARAIHEEILNGKIDQYAVKGILMQI